MTINTLPRTFTSIKTPNSLPLFSFLTKLILLENVSPKILLKNRNYYNYKFNLSIVYSVSSSYNEVNMSS